jgi:5-(carboxyamino)imidazole ribonucleotide synthase
MTVGIVGAGQLGRMLALAGYPLGLDFLFLDPSKGAPAGQVAPQIVGGFTDMELLGKLARDTEVLTFDWENISVDALRALPPETIICPPVDALAAAQDRVLEKQLFEHLKIPTTRWSNVESHADLDKAIARIGLPGVLKTRRLGYDGKGQKVLRKSTDVAGSWDEMGQVPLLYEELVPFDYEVSIIGARSRSGEIAVYPLNGNVHGGGILRLTRAPYGSPTLQRAAAQHLRRALTHFRYTGILTIEFFVRRGKLIANEMAPRVHNSGHWTIEGAETSQFENHLRAILDLPLGSTRARGHCGMLNLIGEMPEKTGILEQDGLHLHDYGKAPRPGRKLGHLTFIERTAAARDRRARRLLGRVAAGVRIP